MVTSPPYWGLRDYGTGMWEGGDAECGHSTPRSRGDDIKPGDKQGTSAGSRPNTQTECPCGARRIDRQIGLEPTPDEYVATMVGVFREVWRVLRDDGTVWLNLGDSYASGGSGGYSDKSTLSGFTNPQTKGRVMNATSIQRSAPDGLKPKDLCGMPWRVAFALQADGWYLRSDIIWAKPNPMPESVTDRPTRSHEYLFLLSKRERYFYDADAIREPAVTEGDCRFERTDNTQEFARNGSDSRKRTGLPTGARNKRDVWTVNSEPTPEAHFATFPQKLIEPCILAGTSEKGCCAECGAPRARVTEVQGARNESWHDHKNDLQRGQRGKSCPPDYARLTKGWLPSCECQKKIGDWKIIPSVPCVVFDPFLGSGTVGKVCERLGRRWAGLELSEAYIDIAKKRTAQRGLFAGVDTSHRVG